MKTGQVVALVIVVAIIGLAIGAAIGTSVSSGKTTTLMSTQTQTVTSNGIPQGLATVTKLVIVSNVLHVNAFACGTDTYAGGTANLENSTTTEYIFPSTTSSQRFLNVTISTITSLQTGLTTTDTTVTLTASSQGNTTGCLTVG